MSTERLIETLAYNLNLACLGNPAPRVAELDARMRAPQVGDFVVECSTIHNPERRGRMGRLLRIVDEPMYTPEEWNESDTLYPIPTQPVWYLELADGTEARWFNCNFIAVPTEIYSLYRPTFVSDPAYARAVPASGTDGQGDGR